MSLDTQRQFRATADRLERLEKPDVYALRLPYAQRVLNPFPLASSGGVPGDFPQSQAIEILAFRVSVLVSTTNTGAAFWTLTLVNTAAVVLASVSTSAIGPNTWARLTDTTITQPATTNVDLAIIATATGSPGAIFIVPEVLAL
jgi:hypothetical protein